MEGVFVKLFGAGHFDDFPKIHNSHYITYKLNDS